MFTFVPMADRAISNKVRDIQDLIGPTKCWPRHIRCIFFANSLNYYQRYLITIFAYVNGLPLHILLDWMQTKHQLKDESATRHVRNLYKSCEDGLRNDHNIYDFYAYNISQGEWQWVNGDRRPANYVHRK